MSRKFRSKFKSVSVTLLALLMVLTSVMVPAVSAAADPQSVVFFSAAAENGSFDSDVWSKTLSGGKELITGADANIIPGGYLQIDYTAASGTPEDGSYTIWGEGGGNSKGSGASYLLLTMMASKADFAAQMTFEFYFNGALIGQRSLADWLSSAGYTTGDYGIGTIDASGNIQGEFKTYSLPLEGIDSGNIQGMKIKFNGGNSSGTVYLYSIGFNNGSDFDAFGYSSARGNYYVAEDGSLPMIRTPESLNGAYAGYNYAQDMMWSVSTTPANIVNNAASGNEKALQISYNTNSGTSAGIAAASPIAGETLLALTMKGSASVNSAMDLVLYNGSTEAARIPFSSLTADADGTVPASVGGTYQTLYARLGSALTFTKVAFECRQGISEELFGTLFVKEISFPRYSYQINYYYDGKIDAAKADSGSGVFGTRIGYTDKNITGYKLLRSDPAGGSLSLSGNNANNVINVYYVKDSFGYTVNYYYDGVLDDSKTVSGSALFGSEVSYADQNIPGYKLDSVSPESGKITIGENAGDNVINVYYAKDSFGYTVNYYYDGVLDDSKTVSGSALFGSEVSYADQNIPGYKLDSVSPESGKITIGENAGDNVINVYYVKDSFGYTVNYYYDGVLDMSKTVSGSALFGSEVGYTDQNVPGYKLDSVSPDSGKITIGENAGDNVINVYYVKDSFGYTVNYYYDGVLDMSKTVSGSALFGSEVGYTDQNVPGYKLDSVSPDSGKITIGENAGDNVINVYYVKDSFGYTVNYYYDGVLDDSKTVSGSALFGSEVGYADQNIPGYKLDSVSPDSGKITIGENAGDNVINVYYVKDSFGYTIEYYYDNQRDDALTVTGLAPYLSTVKYEEKGKDGFVLDRVCPENGSVVISAEAGENVIRVYYRSVEKPPVPTSPKTDVRFPYEWLFAAAAAALGLGLSAAKRKKSCVH